MTQRAPAAEARAAERLANSHPEPARDLLERYREVERMLAGLTRSLDQR